MVSTRKYEDHFSLKQKRGRFLIPRLRTDRVSIRKYEAFFFSKTKMDFENVREFHVFLLALFACLAFFFSAFTKAIQVQ